MEQNKSVTWKTMKNGNGKGREWMNEKCVKGIEKC